MYAVNNYYIYLNRLNLDAQECCHLTLAQEKGMFRRFVCLILKVI